MALPALGQPENSTNVGFTFWSAVGGGLDRRATSALT